MAVSTHAAGEVAGTQSGRRVVLLGASNLARGLSSAVETARLVWGGPLDVLAAFCRGRSYGLCRGVLWHQMPGITECGLWGALAARPPAPTAALVTDVGNDLIYDVPVAEIAAWVRVCMERLAGAGARVVLTPLPLVSIGRLSPAKYRFLRGLLFPGCRLARDTVVSRAHELDERLRNLARELGAQLAEPRPEWYGFDPIHLRRSCYPAAWHSIMSHWTEGETPPSALAQLSLRRWLRLKLLAPERRWLFGRERHGRQPAGGLPDGSKLSLY